MKKQIGKVTIKINGEIFEANGTFSIQLDSNPLKTCFENLGFEDVIVNDDFTVDGTFEDYRMKGMYIFLSEMEKGVWVQPGKVMKVKFEGPNDKN